MSFESLKGLCIIKNCDWNVQMLISSPFLYIARIESNGTHFYSDKQDVFELKPIYSVDIPESFYVQTRSLSSWTGMACRFQELTSRRWNYSSIFSQKKSIPLICNASNPSGTSLFRRKIIMAFRILLIVWWTVEL